MTDLASKTKKGLQWSALERFLTQGIQLAITLYLARLLGPTAFGLVGMLAVFIAIANVFVDSGFTSALIRKTDRTESDLVTAFYYNIAMAGLCYFALYISAPFVADFYQQAELQPLLRILGLSVLINAFTLIPRVKLNVAMDFKTQAKISVLSVLISGPTAIILAINGYGVWALVMQTLLNASCATFLFNLFVPWLPRGRITKHAFNYLFGYGSKLLLSGLLDVTYNNLYQIIIGKKFSPAVVGQFTQANQLASVPVSTLTGIIQRVTFPLFSQLQGDPDKMANAYRQTLKLSALVIFPLIVALGVIAKPLLTSLLGEQWQGAAALLSVLCLGYMLYPIHSINLNLLQVTGRSDLFLKLEVMKKVIGVTVLLLSIPYGVLAMCLGFTLTSYLALLLNTYYTAKLTHFSQWQQCKDILPIWLAVIFAAAVGYGAGLYFLQPWLQIAVNLSVALLLYGMYLVLVQKPLLLQLRSTLRR
ncbi:lipopolysaccharide biosynthesis protein [Vibrio vulnificus]|uniref:lipopolysaccharide biosynthesis protein n=1 Tax=Vibrio vulnificus TaxID=672 RepID=UPI001CDC5AB1|nr:lipopolysaccharide biosynthesis protein [Vibrio vulnificus]EHD0099007.1 lipopolysaccharide biosynthesis protein [Vibrio vulnificus]ELX4206525.1 lipopolysaccharide biosynthesis protein [Vibrio vulnificus]MCA3879410.1 lipopolysaccharide biosynthesis protein [Vibrio vulnificus]MCA3949248.1 lipopolysaccharide biosynthesis protein [Vibrio vulnificus]